jgi:signal peptidase I
VSAPGRPPAHRPPHAPHGILQTLAAVLRVLVIGTFVLTFILQTYRIPSGSMIPTLEVGDCVLVSKTALTRAAQAQSASLAHTLQTHLLPLRPIHRGDLLVFHYPLNPARLLVKRVIGLPGDHIHLRDGRVFLNSAPLQEPYALYTPARPDVFRDEFPNLHETDPNVDPAWWLALRRTLGQDGDLLIPPGRYFVLGDNRNNSEDSRYWGFVSDAEIIGRPILVYFAVPNGADAPEGGPLARLHWVAGYVRQRTGILH